MLIDCDACAVRGPACGDCVVPVLLGAPPVQELPSLIDLDSSEQAAIAVLARCGLVPPLRLVPLSVHRDPVAPDDDAAADDGGTAGAARLPHTVHAAPGCVDDPVHQAWSAAQAELTWDDDWFDLPHDSPHRRSGLLQEVVEDDGGRRHRDVS